MSYRNLHTTNNVTDGQRSATVVVMDTGSLQSQELLAYIVVMDRNDGPAINIGAGTDMDSMITFTENGPSVAIVTAFLLSVMDEEGDGIFSMSIQLRATVGNLDPYTVNPNGGDLLLLRTPIVDPFLDPDIVINETYIYVKLDSNPAQYAAVLESVRYSNTLPEPTLFDQNGMEIQREIVITITDENLESTVVRVQITIEPINDNRPVITINSDPSSCSEDYIDRGETITRSRRDVKFASKQRRKRMMYPTGNNDNSWVCVKSHFSLVVLLSATEND